jgi:hypothetical protein
MASLSHSEEQCIADRDLHQDPRLGFLLLHDLFSQQGRRKIALSEVILGGLEPFLDWTRDENAGRMNGGKNERLEDVIHCDGDGKRLGMGQHQEEQGEVWKRWEVKGQQTNLHEDREAHVKPKGCAAHS